MYQVSELDKERVLEGYFSSFEPLRMKNFPAKEKKKYITLLYIIDKFEKQRYYTEKEINAILESIYDDYATIRRYLVDYQFMAREKNGSKYWVIEKNNYKRKSMDQIKANKIAWNMLAKDHYHAFKTALEKDPVLLSDIIVDELGDIFGLNLIHLQCNVGQDTLSLANLGAKVTGVDLSTENIIYAKKLATDFNIDAKYIEADIMELSKTHNELYDIVFTSEGAIGWLPDLDIWAKTIRGLLKPEGFFYVNDIHPFFLMLDEDEYAKKQTKLKYPYFGRIPDKGDTIGGYATSPRPAVSYYWMYSISDVVNALINAGLKIDYIHEFDSLCYKLGNMEKAGKSGFRFPEHKGMLPLEFSIKASVLK